MTEHTADHVHQLETRQQVSLWFGVAAGPVIWAIYLTLAYAVQTVSCQWRFLHTNILGMHGLRFTLLAITAVATLLILYGAVISLRFWRRYRGDADDNRPESNRFRFLAYAGVVLSALFAVVTLLSAVPILVLGICS
jgi:hypothetical protein